MSFPTLRAGSKKLTPRLSVWSVQLSNEGVQQRVANGVVKLEISTRTYWTWT